MTKLCLSMKDDGFDKCLRKNFVDKKKSKKILETIEQLEKAENEHFSTGGGDRTRLNKFGKTLSKMGQKDIYCLEVGTDRVLGHVVEDEKSKIFIWFWAGSHEAYNNMLKNLSNNKIINVSEEEINKEKEKMLASVKSLTGKYRGDNETELPQHKSTHQHR